MKKREGQNTWEDYEVFTSKGAKIKDPKVTITENSTFLFNAAFVHKADIAKYTRVILGYSPQNKIITFQFTKDTQAKGALTLINRPGSAAVVSNAFFNFYFLNIQDLAGRYVPKILKIPKVGEVWAIDLSSKVPEK